MIFSVARPTSSETRLLPAATAVLWLGCVEVGLLGLWLGYPYPRPPVKEPTPVQAEVLNVQITNAPLPPLSLEAPRLPAPMSPPPLTAMAMPSPPDAMAQPDEHPPPIAAIPHGPVQQLVYGRGEGVQPAPEYPQEAVLARQQGVVVIRFRVGPDGRVQMARATSPCPWPLLNQAALRAVSDTWQFRPGPVRWYDVSIDFQLRERTY